MTANLTGCKEEGGRENVIIYRDPDLDIGVALRPDFR